MRQQSLAMASMGSNGLLMLAIAVLATRNLSPVEQGFFFAFLSLGTLVQLADFGLSYGALQTASHLVGRGQEEELPPFATRVLTFNILTTATAGTLVGVLGAWLIGREPQAREVLWQGPWYLFMAGVLLAQLTASGLALREGSGQIESVWALRLQQEWAGGAACAAALFAGWGLFGLALMYFGRALPALAWLHRRRYHPNPSAAPYTWRRWRTEVWPFQWRIGVSGLSGYFIFRAFPIIVLLEQGPIPAGKIGLSIAMMNLLLAVTSAWPVSQAARFGMLVASRRFAELLSAVNRLLPRSTLLSATLGGTAALVIWYASESGWPIAARLASPGATTVVLVTASIHHLVMCMAVPLRAERMEPLLTLSFFGSLATCLAIWLAAHYGTLFDIALTNLACASIGLIFATRIYRERLHHWSRS